LLHALQRHDLDLYGSPHMPGLIRRQCFNAGAELPPGCEGIACEIAGIFSESTAGVGVPVMLPAMLR
jgi:hypothetical protein